MISNDLIRKHPALFHKYIVGSRTNVQDIPYSIIYNIYRPSYFEKTFVCHFHCYTLNDCIDIYGDILQHIVTDYPVIITYCKIDYTKDSCVVLDKIRSYPVILLKIQNKGMDIGAKFCATKYILKSFLKVQYIFYLHSKYDPIIRGQYYTPFVKDRETFINCVHLANTHQYHAIFPNLKKLCDRKDQYVNMVYIKDIVDYYGCKVCNMNFYKGNVYIFSKEMAEMIFTDPIIYTILNTKGDFDFNWIKLYYKLPHEKIVDIFKIYQTKKLIGNNLDIRYNTQKIKELRDGMIEHAFERIYPHILKSKQWNFTHI